MPDLRCEVKNCVHNASYLCELGEISVKGRKASDSAETCCSTFCDCDGALKHEKNDSTTSSAASASSQIQCSAKNCNYNDNCNCSADSINVVGHGAKSAEHTVCSTFCCH